MCIRDRNRAAQATASASTAAAANASQPFGRSLGDDFIRIPRRIVRTEPVRDARSRQQPAVLCHQDQVKVIDAAAPELQRPVLPHDEQGRGEGVAHRACLLYTSCNCAGCNAGPVAELAVTLMSMLLHRTLWGDRMVRALSLIHI